MALQKLHVFEHVHDFIRDARLTRDTVPEIELPTSCLAHRAGYRKHNVAGALQMSGALINLVYSTATLANPR